METLKEEKPFQQIAKDLDLYPVQVSEWKRKLSEEALGFLPALAASLPGRMWPASIKSAIPCVPKSQS
jgi:hypothetical protein